MTQAVFTPLTNFDSTELVDIAKVHSQSLRLLQAVMRADLKGNLKNLLWLLCMHYNDEKCCAWPSIERLAKLAVTEERTVTRNLKILVDMGLVAVGRVPGIRSNAYAVQEFAVQAIAIDGIRPAKNALSAAVFTPEPTAPTPTFSVSNPDIGGTNPDIFSTNPDTSVTQTEGTEGTEKNGGGTDAPASTISAASASAPVALATLIPASSSPALFASPIQVPQDPAEQHAIALVNTQRVSNGKKPFALSDLHQLRNEATKAGISTQQAAEWILERTSRNFFRADFFMPPAPVQPAPQAHTVPTVARAPVPNHYPATPTETPASDAPNVPNEPSPAGLEGRAYVQAMLNELCAKGKLKSAAKPVSSEQEQPMWAVNIVADARKGKNPSYYTLTNACEALGIDYRQLRAEIAAATETATA
jgi:DNA-binding transcriptional regulator YhcF (GntR family)